MKTKQEEEKRGETGANACVIIVTVKCNHTRFCLDELSFITLTWGTLTGGARQHGQAEYSFKLKFIQTGLPYQSGR